MNKLNLIYFQGNTQFENSGDILINRALIEFLRLYGNLIVNDSQFPSFYSKALKLNSNECFSSFGNNFYLHLIWKGIKNILNNENDMFLIAGPPGHVFGNSNKQVFRNYITSVFLFLIKLFGVRVFRIGFSLGPLGSELAKSEKFKSRFMHHYLVRDSISLDLAKQIGVKNAEFFPDLAWIYDVERDNNQIPTKPKVLISFRESLFTDSTNELSYDVLYRQLVDIMTLIQSDYSFLICFQVKEDYSFCKRLYDDLCAVFDIDFDREQIDLDSAPIKYSDSCMILTNRLHAALLAYKYGSIPLILTDVNKHWKIKGIYSDAGLSDFLLDINNDSSTNAQRVNNIRNERVKYLSRVKMAEESYYNMATDKFNSIFNNSND